MKINQLFTICGIAAVLCWGPGSLWAQNDNGGNGGGPGGFGRGNFDPAQFQQRMMDNVRDELGFTNDTDWSAIQPLIQKVRDDRREMAGAGMRMMFRRSGGNNQDHPRRGGFFGQPNPEAEALQQAIDSHVPDAQLQQALQKYQASMKQKQAQLDKDQENLRKVLTIRQEAQATLMGLLQ